jgi:sec-independent protein translocase protein TatA
VFEPSPIHLLMLVVILLLVLGPKRLPQVARSLGRGVRELRASIADEDPPRASPDPPAPTRETAKAEFLDQRPDT